MAATRHPVDRGALGRSAPGLSDSLSSAVLESAPDSVIVIDSRGILVELNPAAERTFGYTREEALGRDFLELMIAPALRRAHHLALCQLGEVRTGSEPVDVRAEPVDGRAADRGMGDGRGETSGSLGPDGESILDRRVELVGMRADSSELPIELTLTRLAHDPPLFAGFIRDVAEQRRVTEAKDRLYAERTHVARTLQRSLLPDALPEMAGVQLASAYHPVGEGNEVGGDFYDVFEVPSGCWLVVGDVCGKGPEAAAVTALVRHSIRALALHEDSPAEVLRHVNDAMLSHKPAGRFATVVLARLDLASGASVRATIAGAGHPPPVVLEVDGRAWCPEIRGTLLGVVRQARSCDREVTLHRGASVILYTDGLTDAGAPGRGFDVAEICRNLAGAGAAEPGVLVRRLEELAREHSTGSLRDDIAIVAARVVPH